MLVICEMDSGLRRAHRVELEGILDAVGASAMWEGVSGRVSKDVPALLVNLSGVRFMSSGGIGMLVSLLARVQQAGGGMSICACPSRVRSVLNICGLEQVLNVRETEEEARERLRELGIT